MNMAILVNFVFGAVFVVATTTAKSPSVIMSILIDDLGIYDTSVYNPNAPTPFLGKLSHEQGMILHRHYTYKYCSPTRRSFLSGRFPVHMTGMQAPICSNWLPLDFTLLSQKLKMAPVPFKNHFVGKGHLGYQTMDHLPINRGFDSHVGYLMGAEEYFHGDNYYGQPNHDCPGKPAQCYKDFWFDSAPANTSVINDVFYSTNYYTSRAVSIIREHDPSNPLWIHLTYQGVHAPYVEPPMWEQIPNNTGFWDQTFGSMLSVVDKGIQNVTEALIAADLWDDAFILISSDNGGVGPGNNYPLRGQKATPWEGGTRVMAFVTGGFLPQELVGTTNDVFISIADWYPTFCALAGVADCTDNIVRGNNTYPIDGVNVWSFLTKQNSTPWAHEYLPTTENGIIYQDRWKLLTGASSTSWYTKNDTHIDDNRTAWPCLNPAPPPSPSGQCTSVAGFICHASSYCGNPFSVENTDSLDACGALCLSNSSCACFDYKDSTECTKTTCSCRLHNTAQPKRSSEGYSAYVRQHGSSFEAEFASLESSESSARDCQLCSKQSPCLFDLLQDPGEYVNMAKANPDMVSMLAAKLDAFIVPQANASIDVDILNRDYDCVTDIRPWWGNFSGPCCKRKSH